MSLMKKVIRVLLAPNMIQRVIQAVNKSPLRHLSKWIAICFAFPTYTRRRNLARLQKLDAVQEKILRDLELKGFAEVADVIPQADLEALLSHGSEKIRFTEEIREKELVKTKGHWVRLSDEDISGNSTDTRNPMVKIALNEGLLKVVSRYLDQAPFLEYVLLTLSQYAGPELKSSQLWHFDRDNTVMLKFFVYLTDVQSVEDGPFTLIDKADSYKVPNSFFMRHLSDSEIHEKVPKERLVQMIKPKLSCFVVDTGRCYHMGSRVQEGHQRLLYTALFMGLPSNYFWTGKEKFSAPNWEGLSELQRAALKV